AVQDESHLYQAPEYSGGLGKGAAYRPPYSQDESTNEGHYECPQYMRSYASTVMQPMLPARAEYAQYAHSVNEALLQRLEHAGQPVPAMVAFLWDDLAVMVVEGLLDQIELMRRQHVSALEQIERIGKHKAPMFEEPMVEPKRARAPSQHPQELACTCMYHCMAATATVEIGERGVNLERAMAILAPPPQLAVVVVTTDPRTPEQYDGLIVTQQKAAAVSKSKGKVVPMLSDESDY
ncbi:hypothetical protein C0995_014532, partial [Termitomyces sp. Mi166